MNLAELHHGVPKPDMGLRQILLEYLVENYDSPSLSDWLTHLDQDPKGTVEDKQSRLLAHRGFVETPVTQFPDEVSTHLKGFPSECLADLCEKLGVSSDGNKGVRHRRILREIGYREGWLPKFGNIPDDQCTLATVVPFVRWHRPAKRWSYERDYYPDVQGDLEEIFGERLVHPQLAVGAGTKIRIDFHIGHPAKPGVGIEFKMPTNKSEIQRAVSRIELCKQHYGDQLIVVFLSDLLDSAKKLMFMEEMEKRAVRVLEK